MVRMLLYRACAKASCAYGESCGCADATACAAPSCVEETVPPGDMELIDRPDLLPPDAQIPNESGPVLNCAEPLRLCATDCVNPQSDPRHCGDCDAACASGQICRTGNCIDPGDCRRNETGCSGFSYCDEASGQCMPGCTESEQCPGQRELCDVSTHDCVCSPGLERCKNDCVDTQSDPSFCGDCKTACSSDNVCELGRCVDPNGADYNPPSEKCGVLRANEGFGRQESLLSCNGRFQLRIKPNGELVLETLGLTLWSSGTRGTKATAAVMQADGNFVLYGSAKVPLWNSKSQGSPGATLLLQNDGNLVVYSTDSTVLWSTDTWER